MVAEYIFWIEVSSYRNDIGFFNIAMKSTESSEVLQNFYTIFKIGSGPS